MSGLRLARSVLSKRSGAIVARAMGGGPNMPPFARTRPPTSKVGAHLRVCDPLAFLVHVSGVILVSFPHIFLHPLFFAAEFALEIGVFPWNNYC